MDLLSNGINLLTGCPAAVHAAAFLMGYVMDLLIGDPYSLPHPIRLIGSLIAALEKLLYPANAAGSVRKRKSAVAGGTDLTDDGSRRCRAAQASEASQPSEAPQPAGMSGEACDEQPNERIKLLLSGALLAAVVIAVTAAVSAALLAAASAFGNIFRIIIEGVMCFYILAAKSLADESLKVYDRLSESDTEGARKAVSMIVGRDTGCLDEAGITRAAVETVAENASDGVIAPMLYVFLGGPVLGFVYKAVNTMDSMIGYKNDRYMYFGRAAARLDDLLNFIPSRLSALLMTAAAFIMEYAARDNAYSAAGAVRIFRRDRLKHASPNSAQTESVCAGALGLRLAGDASYFGVVHHKPYIGDALREIEAEDIRRAVKLMYIAEFICFAVYFGILCRMAV